MKLLSTLISLCSLSALAYPGWNDATLNPAYQLSFAHEPKITVDLVFQTCDYEIGQESSFGECYGNHSS